MNDNARPFSIIVLAIFIQSNLFAMENIKAQLLQATKQQKYIAVKNILNSKISPNTQDDQGYTPLHYAVLSSNQKMIKLLLQHNAQLNTQDNNGNSPLHFAVF